MSAAQARRIDRSQFELEFDESFRAPILSRDLWFPHYLPQWSSREQSAARYAIRDGMLRLRIDEDQAPWSPEFEGELKISSLRTGVSSGAVGTSDAQHRYRDGLTVREAQVAQRLYTPHFGLVEARAKAIAHPRFMVALWMIGYDDIPARSAELCVFEIFGRGVCGRHATVGLGVHPFGDPAIFDDFRTLDLELDATEFHTYAVEWMPGRSLFYVDDVLVAEVEQAPDYPLQLMLGVFEFPAKDEDEDEDEGNTVNYPKEFIVDFVRGYRRSANSEP